MGPKLDSEQERITKSVQEDDVVRLTRDLIGLRSINPPGTEIECAEYIAQAMRDLGLEVQLVEREKGRPNVIGLLKGSEGSPRLLYNGHIDVVPPGNGWRFEPFSGMVVGGRIYGRGASDMKSGLAAMMLSAKALVAGKTRLKGDLIIAAVVDEETTGPAGTAYLVNQGLMADMAIIGEPTYYLDPSKGWRIEIAHRGHLWIEVTTEGKAAHGGRPWLGINAIYMMTDVINSIRRLEDQFGNRKHPLVSSPTINIGTISGGTSVNVVPDRCTMTIDRRMIPAERIEEAKLEIAHILEELGRNDKFKASWTAINETPPFEISPNEDVVVSLRKTAAQIMGHEPTIGGKDATTDAHFLVKAGIPTAIFGPGIVETAHTTDEYAEIQKIVEATKIYTLMAHEVLI